MYLYDTSCIITSGMSFMLFPAKTEHPSLDAHSLSNTGQFRRIKQFLPQKKTEQIRRSNRPTKSVINSQMSTDEGCKNKASCFQ